MSEFSFILEDVSGLNSLWIKSFQGPGNSQKASERSPPHKNGKLAAFLGILFPQPPRAPSPQAS